MKRNLEDLVRQITQQISIREIIGDYVRLQKRGANYVGLCPFHHEKDPSFTVSEEKGFFYCFGCHKSGNAIKFVMEIENLTFTEAIKKIAARYGFEIDKFSITTQKHDENTQIASINRMCMEFFEKKFWEDALPQEYVRRRGLSTETIKAFHIGYAPDKWDALIDFLQKNSISLTIAEKAGLIIKNDRGSYYDRFRNRLIFPIFNMHGDVVGFGGRTLGDDKPKYLNTPETPVYKKGSILYGLYQNKEHIRKKGHGYIVEGYVDLISLWQHGIKEVVATLGTALTHDHAKLLKNYTKKWTLVFDGDEAGIKATMRAIPILYSNEITIKVLELPEGEDPDTFIQKYGHSKWNELTENAPSGIDFILNFALKKFGNDLNGKLEVIDFILPMFNEIQDPVKKNIIITTVSNKLNIDEKALWEKISNTSPITRLDSTQISQKNRFKDNSEVILLSFILNNLNLIDEFKDFAMDLWLKDETIRNIWHETISYYLINGSNIPLNLLYEKFGKDTINEILQKKPLYSSKEEINTLIQELKNYCKNRESKAIRTIILEQLKCNEANNCDIDKLLAEYKELLCKVKFVD